MRWKKTYTRSTKRHPISVVAMLKIKAMKLASITLMSKREFLGSIVAFLGIRARFEAATN